MDYTTIYSLAGRGIVLAQKWEPPASSARMTTEQRRVVEQMIEVMVNGTATVDAPRAIPAFEA